MVFYIDTSIMTEGLGLCKTELLVYALIHSFSQGEYGCYWGSVATTAKALGCGTDAVRNALKNLQDKGLIRQVGFNPEYKTNQYSTTPLKNLPPSEKSADPSEKSATPLGKSEPIYNKYKNNIKDNIESSARARFIKPSIEDIDNYCRERRNGIDANEFFDHYEANGWKVGPAPMKDWRAAIRTWEAKRKKQTPSPSPSPKYKPHHTGVDKAVDILKEIYAMDAAPDPNIYDLDDQSPF